LRSRFSGAAVNKSKKLPQARRIFLWVSLFDMLKSQSRGWHASRRILRARNAVRRAIVIGNTAMFIISIIRRQRERCLLVGSRAEEPARMSRDVASLSQTRCRPPATVCRRSAGGLQSARRPKDCGGMRLHEQPRLATAESAIAITQYRCGAQVSG
jgi:hypothetical protein